MYVPEELLPVLSAISARPLLPVVAVVELSDTVPSFGVTLNVTVFPDTGLPPS